MSIQIHYYTTSGGRQPVADLVAGSPARTQAAILTALERVEEWGFDAPGISFRKTRGRLWEIRIRSATAIRIFYLLRRSRDLACTVDEMIQLHGYEKGTRKAPRAEIETAERRMREILR